MTCAVKGIRRGATESEGCLCRGPRGRPLVEGADAPASEAGGAGEGGHGVGPAEAVPARQRSTREALSGGKRKVTQVTEASLGACGSRRPGGLSGTRRVGHGPRGAANAELGGLRAGSNTPHTTANAHVRLGAPSLPPPPARQMGHHLCVATSALQGTAEPWLGATVAVGQGSAPLPRTGSSAQQGCRRAANDPAGSRSESEALCKPQQPTQLV